MRISDVPMFEKSFMKVVYAAWRIKNKQKSLLRYTSSFVTLHYIHRNPKTP